MERAALSYCALQPDAAAHESGQPGAYGEAQSGTAVVAGGAAVGLRKRLKYQGMFLGGNADACVGDTKMQVKVMMAARLHLDSNHHLPLSGELNGVSHKVYKNLA